MKYNKEILQKIKDDLCLLINKYIDSFDISFIITNVLLKYKNNITYNYNGTNNIMYLHFEDKVIMLNLKILIYNYKRKQKINKICLQD